MHARLGPGADFPRARELTKGRGRVDAR
jgi:hypothetical protein